MLPRHRRRFNSSGDQLMRRPRLLVRVIIAVIVLLIVWTLVSRLLAFFDRSIGRKTAATLAVQGEGAQVSLQGGEWQRGESNLKIYAGDGVATRGSSRATLTLFDRSMIIMDTGTEITLDRSDKLPESTSRYEITLKTGRLWIRTPDLALFTGAIIRSITTANYEAEVPGDTAALLAAGSVNVVRASGLGVKLALTFADSAPEVYVGEGQYYAVTDDSKSQIAAGKDPYAFRDPTPLELLRDEFLTTSFTASEQIPLPDAITGSGSTSSVASGQALTVTEPQNRAQINAKSVTVKGTVNDKVRTLTVNGQVVTIAQNRTFSVNVSLSSEPTTSIHIEAQDQQGLPLGVVDRTVENVYKPVVEAVRIKSPVGSGETLRTDLNEVEITGEAPAGTQGVMVNDYKLQLFKPGSKTWSYLASVSLGNMKVGTNVFTVYALDAEGNKSPPRSITIEVSSAASVPTGSGAVSSQPPLKQNAPIEPGSLKVTAPVAGTTADTAEKETVLEGTTSPNTYSISVNGYTLSLYVAGKTTWNYIASTDLSTMKRGKNVYRVVSRNQDGEILDVLEYTLNYKP